MGSPKRKLARKCVDRFEGFWVVRVQVIIINEKVVADLFRTRTVLAEVVESGLPFCLASVGVRVDKGLRALLYLCYFYEWTGARRR